MRSSTPAFCPSSSLEPECTRLRVVFPGSLHRSTLEFRELRGCQASNSFSSFADHNSLSDCRAHVAKRQRIQTRSYALTTGDCERRVSVRRKNTAEASQGQSVEHRKVHRRSRGCGPTSRRQRFSTSSSLAPVVN